MVRSVFAATLAVVMIASPAMALAQTEMLTYNDTLRKKSGAHSAVHPVKREAVSAKHGNGGGKHTTAKGHRRK